MTQDRKFDPQFRQNTFDLYSELVTVSRGRLIVLPESAFPVFADEVPDAVLLHLLRTAAARDGDVLLGLFTVDRRCPAAGCATTAACCRWAPASCSSTASGTSCPSARRFPPMPCWGGSSATCCRSRSPTSPPARPTSRRSRSPARRWPVNICYEDAFSADIRTQAGAATLLVNVTNDAWYGRSLAALQHNQIAAMRAKETGRTLLRATNTGITSAIGTTAASSRGCPGSPAASSKSTSSAGKASRPSCAPATRRRRRSRPCC
ncbi:MAG: hypothetical protein IPG28_01705 [Betaproteobacteria bacterium]|nr:hypothetical protein [Betaproteobacteria bacterium]